MTEKGRWFSLWELLNEYILWLKKEDDLASCLWEPLNEYILWLKKEDDLALCLWEPLNEYILWLKKEDDLALCLWEPLNEYILWLKKEDVSGTSCCIPMQAESNILQRALTVFSVKPLSPISFFTQQIKHVWSLLERVVFSPSHSKCLAVKSAGGQETARDSSVSLNLKVRDRKKKERKQRLTCRKRERRSKRERDRKKREVWRKSWRLTPHYESQRDTNILTQTKHSSRSSGLTDWNIQQTRFCLLVSHSFCCAQSQEGQANKPQSHFLGGGHFFCWRTGLLVPKWKPCPEFFTQQQQRRDKNISVCPRK